MRVLLTGVSGQVGAALALPLGRVGTVIAADRAMLDLSRPDGLSAVLDAMAPELIVNPAAYTAVDRAEDDRDLAFAVNALAPGAIARWAAERGVPLLHVSTDYVFDGSGDRPWREDDPTGPLSVYGASKLAGEEAIRRAGGPHLIVRTSWVYAARGANFLRTIARLARERRELRVVADQFGAPTSAATVAEAITGLVGADVAGAAAHWARACGLVHLSAAGATSWHGFACAIVEGLRTRGVALETQSVVPIATAEFPTRARRPANSRLDMTRLKEQLGIEPPSWSDALAPELDRLAAELQAS